MTPAKKTKLSDGKLVLDTDLVKIFFTGSEYQVFITMSKGGIIEHEPFSGDLQGQVAALQLATEICAGKLFPRRVVGEGEAPKIKRQMLEAPKNQPWEGYRPKPGYED